MAERKKPQSNNKNRVTRRDFLKGGGAMIASAVLFKFICVVYQHQTHLRQIPTTAKHIYANIDRFRDKYSK